MATPMDNNDNNKNVTPLLDTVTVEPENTQNKNPSPLTRKRIQISVHPVVGSEKFEVTLTRNDMLRVSNLKNEISRRIGVSPSSFTLLDARNNSLSNESELNSYDFFENSFVRIVPCINTGIQASHPSFPLYNSHCGLFSSPSSFDDEEYNRPGTLGHPSACHCSCDLKNSSSVLSALNSLRESQILDFMSGSSPLNLTMRVGQHLLLVQVQLGQRKKIEPPKPRTNASETTTAPVEVQTEDKESKKEKDISSYPVPGTSKQTNLPSTSASCSTGSDSKTPHCACACALSLTRVLKKLSSEEETREKLKRNNNMRSHGNGVYSAVFCGTLQSSSSDKESTVSDTGTSANESTAQQAPEDISKQGVRTIVEILNDLVMTMDHSNDLQNCCPGDPAGASKDPKCGHFKHRRSWTLFRAVGRRGDSSHASTSVGSSRHARKWRKNGDDEDKKQTSRKRRSCTDGSSGGGESETSKKKACQRDAHQIDTENEILRNKIQSLKLLMERRRNMKK